MIKAVTSLLFKKIDGTGLAVFRIFYSIVLFCELVQLYTYRDIIYNRFSDVEPSEINVTFLFGFWFLTVVLLFFGLFTRTASVINYLFSVIIFSSAQKFEYHVFYLYVGVNFLIMFMPVSRSLSLDALLEKVKFSRPGHFHKPDKQVLAVNYFMPVLLGLAFVYFDSTLYKFASPMWLKGLGMWLPANLPMATWTDTTWIMNQEWLVKFFGYLVMVFETLFIFLFWFRFWRVPLLLIGVFFHVGILIQFPIPWFALSAIAVYILMVPVSWWRFVSAKLKFSKPKYDFYYDAECPLCVKTVTVIRSIDLLGTVNCQTVQSGLWRDSVLKDKNEDDLLITIHGVSNHRKIFTGYSAYSNLLVAMVFTWPLGVIMKLPGVSALGEWVYRYIAGNRLTVRCTPENCPIPVFQAPVSETEDFLVSGMNRLAIARYAWMVLIVVLFVLQFFVSSTSRFPQEILMKTGLHESGLNRFLKTGYSSTYLISRKYLGLTHHALFMDFHFKGYNHIFKVDYKSSDGTKLIPLLNEDGSPAAYIRGALWADYTFRLNSPKITQGQLEEISKYLRYYCQENGIKTASDGVQFDIYVKHVEIPKDWKENFLHEQIAKPWTEAGSCKLYEKSEIFSWNSSMLKIFDQESGQVKQQTN